MKDNNQARIFVCEEINENGFDLQILIVCAFGFLTDSYALFATSVVLPSIAYLYWPEDTSGRPEVIINCVTLAGVMVGQILFGFLADKYGRRRLYGVELLIVIFSTLGMAQASTGLNNSMNIRGWIYFWRLFIGIGIGAKYPLTAVIASEFAAVNSRAQMLAAVFSMQPVGQILATGIGWAALSGFQTRSQDPVYVLEQTWRCLIGVGAGPALLAILFRLTIPESPRYTIDVIKDGEKAATDYRRYQDKEHSTSAVRGAIMSRATQPGGATDVAGNESVREDGTVPEDPDRILPYPNQTHGGLPQTGSANASEGPRASGMTTISTTAVQTTEMPQNFTWEKLKEYFWDEGNLKYLLATSICWGLLDFAFYGLGINNPRQLGAIWENEGPPSNTEVADWQNSYYNITETPNVGIYNELYYNAYDYIMTISIGSLVGSILLIWLINKIRCKTVLVWSFIILAGGFTITASTLQKVEFTGSNHWLTVVFYGLCQFFFNVGPNSLTFIIPAEIFPTRYRCTCYGISAATGKFASILVLLVLKYATKPEYAIQLPLGVFAILMFLGAILASVWLPDVQEAAQDMTFPNIPSKALEVLARGYRHAVALKVHGGEGQRLTFPEKFHDLLAWLKGRGPWFLNLFRSKKEDSEFNARLALAQAQARARTDVVNGGAH